MKESNEFNSYDKYVGMDVHKDSISVAVAAAGRAEARFYGKIDNKPEAIRRLISALAPSGQRLHFCYEAGPCGYGICRQIRDTEHDCDVVAPSMTPRKSGDRVKTDRRDGLTLARLDRAAELTAVWTPSREHEAIRDLSRGAATSNSSTSNFVNASGLCCCATTSASAGARIGRKRTFAGSRRSASSSRPRRSPTKNTRRPCARRKAARLASSSSCRISWKAGAWGRKRER